MGRGSRRASAVLSLVGFAAMGQELLWARMLAGFTGGETVAVLAVVAAWFGGTSLGALLLDRPLVRQERPTRALAWMLGAVALGSWLVQSLLPAAGRGLDAWWAPETSPAALALGTFGAAFLVFLPATLPLGGVLVAVDRWEGVHAWRASRLASLVGWQTLGAAVGVIAVTWYLVPYLGLRGSGWLLAAAHGLGALLAVGVPERVRSSVSGVPPPTPWVLLLLGGLLGLTVELLVVRGLAEVFDGTVFSHAAALTAWLLWAALGAAWQSRSRADPPTRTVLLLVASGASVGVALVLLHVARPLFGLASTAWPGWPAELTTAALVLGAPALCSGAWFCHLAGLSRGEGGGLGRALAWNGLGATLAPAVVFLGLAAMTLDQALLLVLLAWLGITLRVTGGAARRVGAVALGATGGAAFLASTWLGAHGPEDRILWQVADATATVTVAQTAGEERELWVDRRFTMGGTAAANGQQRQAHLPLLLHPAPRRVLLLGLGTGITAGAALQHPGLEVRVVELLPGVVAAREWFAPVHGGLRESARLCIHVGDARRAVRAEQGVFDLVLGDVFHPRREGAGLLYSREHFAAVRRCLEPGGLFCQWLPMYQLSEAAARSIVRTFLEVFPEARAFLLRPNLDVPVVGLVGWTRSLGYATGWMEARVTDAGLREVLRGLPLQDDLRLFGAGIAGPEALARWSEGAPANTQDRPEITFAGAGPGHGPEDPGAAFWSLWEAGRRWPEPGWIQGSEAGRTALGDWSRARDAFLEALRAEQRGDGARAVERALDSVRASADFTTSYAWLLRRATLQSAQDPGQALEWLRALEAARPEQAAARRLRERLER